MAKKSVSVWGIDIGQCALKALRCSSDNGEVVADAFDYIEYPKILSQPEADPRQLVKEALAQFLSRNDVQGCKVAISVPGQTGLTKFFKPPPMDQKRVANIVQYEARQQIPFSLEEVVWDFQQMAGSQVDEDLGLLIESEIGLFAMKRDQVYRAMHPFDEADVELDIIQLAPLCVYNYVSHDILSEGPSEDEFDPDDPPESMVVLSMGTDTTDLVVTNGFRVWQRSVPVGGNHFTKQLTRSMKLTFAKAEHLKRNAREAEDPKKVFQAMRPVFTDLVTEVQRSIGYFQGIDRKAKITGVVLLGNAVKLPGIKQFLGRNLGYKIVDFSAFSRLKGSSVTSSPVFKDNALAFGVCYGLCMQGLGQSKLSTNLVPREILNDRLVRAKKPWALATVSILLLACAFNFLFQYRSWSKVQPGCEVGGIDWTAAQTKATATIDKSTEYKSQHQEQEDQLNHLTAIGAEVGGNADRRLLWLELLKAVSEVVPQDPDIPSWSYVSPVEKPFDERKDVHIEYVESEYFSELGDWFTGAVKTKYAEGLAARAKASDDEAEPASSPAAQASPEAAATPPPGAPGAPATMPPGAPGAVAAMPPGAADTAAAGGGELGPQGPGWVIELKGYHYYNSDLATGRATYVRTAFLKNIEEGEVELPSSPTETKRFTLKELGIGYPILAVELGIRDEKIPNPEYEGPQSGGDDEGQEGAAEGENSGAAGPGSVANGSTQPDPTDLDPKNRPYFEVQKYSFIVQFCWQEKLLSGRLEDRRQAKEQEQLEAEGQEQEGESQPVQGDVASI